MYLWRNRVVRDDNIDMDDREIYLADIPVDDSPIVQLLLDDVDDFTNPSNDIAIPSIAARRKNVDETVRPISDIARAISHRFY